VAPGTTAARQRLGRKIRSLGRIGESFPKLAPSSKAVAGDPSPHLTSESDLAEQMLAYVETYNQTAQPFEWTYTCKILKA
jgi:hypothetical protein